LLASIESIHTATTMIYHLATDAHMSECSSSVYFSAFWAMLVPEISSSFRCALALITSIYFSARQMPAVAIWILSVCPCVCPTVRLSVTLLIHA